MLRPWRVSTSSGKNISLPFTSKKSYHAASPDYMSPFYLGGRFGFFCSCSRRGKGESEAPRERGGIGFFKCLKIPGRGGFSGGGGAEGPGGCLQRIGEFLGGGGAIYFFFWGRGAIYFFSGPKRPPSYVQGILSCIFYIVDFNKKLWPNYIAVIWGRGNLHRSFGPNKKINFVKITSNNIVRELFSVNISK